MSLLLSIVVPLYNSAKYIIKCLDSLLMQDIPHSEYEIILVNDGSPDNSLQLAEEYSRRYLCIKVFSQDNQGVSSARNTGIRNAQGKYLCFVDPDDYVKPNSLKLLLDTMEMENLDMLRFRYIMVNENGERLKFTKLADRIDYTSKRMSGKEFLSKRLGTACFVWTFIYRTTIIKDNDLYCSEGVYFDDVDWMPKVLNVAKAVNTIDFERYFYVIRQDSLVNHISDVRIKKYLEGILQILSILKKDKEDINDTEVSLWYNRQMDMTIYSYIVKVGIMLYDNKSIWLSKIEPYIKDLSLKRICKYDIDLKSRIKLCMVYISPINTCRLFHFWNLYKRKIDKD